MSVISTIVSAEIFLSWILLAFVRKDAGRLCAGALISRATEFAPRLPAFRVLQLERSAVKGYTQYN